MMHLFDWFIKPISQWIDGIEIHSTQAALFYYRLIPAQCPFARKVSLFGHHLFTIPPLCKINPWYDDLMGLRFRASCYLVDECGMDLATMG